ncbi:MAG: BON domain-containing protein [Anaerolineae bacterium]
MAVGTSQTAQRVEAALKEDERTSDYPIEVIEHGGTVTLKGNVPSAKIREVAESIASKQEGVVAVTNALTIDQDLEPDVEDLTIVPPNTTSGTGTTGPNL